MQEKLRVIGRFFTQLGGNVLRHDIASLSAQICFYAIFSVFPLIILVVFGASLIVPHLDIQNILAALRPYYPAVGDANSFITFYINNLATVGAKVGVVSFITLMWSATSGFIAVQQAMDKIFEIDDVRSFFARRFVGFLMLILLVIVAVLSSIALTVYPQMQHTAWWPLVATWATFLHGLTRILYPLSLFITCFIFYRFLPSRRIDLNSVFIGALTSTVILDLARTLFVLYAGHLVSYHLIYGSLTVVMLLVMWLYIAGIILLFGAEIAAALDNLGRQIEMK